MSDGETRARRDGIRDAMHEQAVDELTAQLQEMVDGFHRVHVLNAYLAAAAISAHVEAGHEGFWLSQPEKTYCPEEECAEFARLALKVSAWLEPVRDILDVEPSADLWEPKAGDA